MLAALVPAMILIVALGLDSQRRLVAEATARVVSLTRVAAEQATAIRDDAHKLLAAVAATEALLDHDPVECAKLLRGLQFEARYANLGAADLEGEVWCSALPLAGPVNIADRAYFRRTLSSGDFAVGDFQVGRITGQPSVNVGYPLRDAAGKPIGIVFAALAADTLATVVHPAELPDGSVITIVDGTGAIVARQPAAPSLIGRSYADSVVGKAVADEPNGVVDGIGIDGVRRLFAFQRVEGFQGSYVSIGVPAAGVLAAGEAALTQAVIALTLVSAFAIVAAWLMGGRLIVHRLRALALATGHVAGGDYRHRTGLARGRDEIADLASAFEAMSGALQEQNAERLRTEEERAHLVERLEQTRRDLEEAQRIARVGSWTLDPATGDATWSPEMYRILGLDPAGPAIGLDDISKLFTLESVREVSAAVERAVQSGEPWQLDLEVVRPDGSRAWVASNGIAERDTVGAVTRIRGTMQDVTDQRRLAGQLRQAQRLEAVGQLAGGVAHDFNNLLTAIRGYAELVRRKLAPDDPNRADVDQVVLAADRAADLTRQLLAFSRRQVLQPRVVDPAEIVAGIAPLLRRLLGEHIELVTYAGPDLGRIKVDPSQFEQVIVNLAVNARDAMPEGGKLTIETVNVELDKAYAATHVDANAGSHVALIVSDTGTGMDAATQARIFEPFFTTKEPGKGTGMGLATVYGVVRQSGGSIYVYSEPGHGTSFKVYLPRALEDVLPEAEVSAPVAAQVGSELILLVEDEAAVRTFAARVLADLGYTVLEAAGGAEALAVAAASGRPIDLLITDVIMPGIQGHQLALQLAADQLGLRVLYVSGFTENSVIHHGVAADGIFFLPKPFTADGLARAVRQALDV